MSEMLATIVIMGILAAIAVSFWEDVVEARRVDSAANQLVADLRLAHTSAANRLAQWQVVTDTATPNTYQTGRVGSLITHTLPEGTGTATAATVTFNANGSATLPGNAATATITAQADDGNPNATIEVIAVTSRVKLD